MVEVVTKMETMMIITKVDKKDSLIGVTMIITETTIIEDKFLSYPEETTQRGQMWSLYQLERLGLKK